MFLRTGALMLLPLLLSACAVPMRVSMTAEQRAQVREINAHIIVVQDEVIAAVQPSNVSVGTGGGLIGAMIDSSVTNSRVKDSQKIMGPFYATIEDVDYRTEFNAEMKRELAGYPIKIAQVVTTPKMVSQAQLNRLRQDLKPGQALLLIVPNYSLSMDFRSLDAEAWVSLWTPGDGNTPVQRGSLRYQSQPMGTGGQASMNLWTANNAALFRSTLRESVSELKQLILMDIDVVAAPATPGDVKAFSFNSGQQQIEIKGRALKETASRRVVLGEDGKLYSLPVVQAAAVAQK